MGKWVLGLARALFASGIPGLTELGGGFLIGYYGARAVLGQPASPIIIRDNGAAQAIANLGQVLASFVTLVELVVGQGIYPCLQRLADTCQHLYQTCSDIAYRLWWIVYAYVPAQVRYVFQTINQVSSSAYRATLAERHGIVQSLIGEIAARNPAVHLITRELEGLILRVLETDNPLEAFIAKELISRLLADTGVDAALARLIGDLAGHLTGGQSPRDLHGTILDLAERLNRVEAWEANFMQHGGPEILQAGDDWKDETSPLTDGALLGFFALISAEPRAAAAATHDTLGVLIKDTIGAVHKLL